VENLVEDADDELFRCVL